jgi:predicted HTH transcriptional regulator
MQLTEYHAKHFAYELAKRCSLDSVEKVAPVFASPGRPRHLKSAGPDGSVYVRVGSTNHRADQELIKELRRFARGESYDEQAISELDS